MTIAVISMIRDSWGGSEELWYQMAKEALQNGHRVLHLAFEHPEIHPKMKELHGLGLQRYIRPGWVPPNAGNKKFFYLGRNYLRKKLKDPFAEIFKQQPDIVIYNGTCYAIGSERGLIRHIASRHNTTQKFFILGQLNSEYIRGITDRDADLIRLAYRLSKVVFFVPQRNLETARRHLCTGIPNGEVIRNPVNLTSVDPIPFPAVKDYVQLALVGNLVTSHKGQDVLFQALSQWEQSDWQLNVYGSGTDFPYLKRLAHFLGLQDKIIFHGRVSDIRSIWEQNHILLMPSLMEGMPLAVVEAMLCGRFCIVTDVGGHSEWIHDGVNGFIAAAPSVDSLNRALNEAWNAKYLWAELAERAHSTATQLFDPHAGATLLRRIIAE